MIPVVHLVLLTLAFAFACAGYFLSSEPDPKWKTVMSLCAAFFIASFISW